MSSFFRSAFSATILLALAASASAQESRPGRPYRGLFGSDGSNWKHVLTVNGSVGGGHDTDFLQESLEAGFFSPSTALQRNSGRFAFFNGSLTYAMDLEGVSLGASFGSMARYYGGTWRLGANLTDAGSIGASFDLTPRTTLSASQRITQQPFTVFSVFPALSQVQPGELILPEQDHTYGLEGYTAYSTGVTLSQELSPRSRVSVDYSYQMNDYDDDIGSFTAQSGMMRFSRALSQNLSLRLGYGYSEGRYRRATNTRFRNHNFDTGVDYNRSLSFSRRTTVSFSSGASAVRDVGYTRFHVTGNATLQHEMGRTWMLSVAYNRNVTFVETVAAPAFFQGVNAGLNGLLARRLSFFSGLGAVIGAFGVQPEEQRNNGFDNYYGSAGLRYALTRNLALGTSYSYYRYAFDATAYVPMGTLPQLGRHSLRAYLTVWAPVFRHGRKTDATR